MLRCLKASVSIALASIGLTPIARILIGLGVDDSGPGVAILCLFWRLSQLRHPFSGDLDLLTLFVLSSVI